MATDNAIFRRHLSARIDELANLITGLRSHSLKQALVLDKLNEEVTVLREGKAHRDTLIKRVLSENRDLKSQCTSLISLNAELHAIAERANKPRVKADLANIRNDGYRRQLLALSSEKHPTFQPISADQSQTSELIDISNQINSLFNLTSKLIPLRGLRQVCDFIEIGTKELLGCSSSQLWFTNADEMWSIKTPQERLGLPVAFASVLKSGVVHKTDATLVVPITISGEVAGVLEIVTRSGNGITEKDETIAIAWASAFSGKIQIEKERELETAKISRSQSFTDFAASLIPIRSFRQLCLVSERLIAELMTSNDCLVFSVDRGVLTNSNGLRTHAARAGLAGACAVSNEVIFLPYGGGADARYDGNVDVRQAVVPLLVFPVGVEDVQLVVEVTRHRSVFLEAVSTEDNDFIKQLTRLLSVCCESLLAENPNAFTSERLSVQSSPARDFSRASLREIANRESQTSICIPVHASLLDSYEAVMSQLD